MPQVDVLFNQRISSGRLLFKLLPAHLCSLLHVGRFSYDVHNMPYKVEGPARPAVAVDLSRLRSLTGVLSVMACSRQLMCSLK